jgi:NAD(P)H dehydrogenase (quinone)
MIAVVGATGNTGRAAVKQLIALGETPVCVVRNPEKARDVLGENARIAVAELTDRPALEKALQGVRTVFVVTGHNPQTDEQQINILEAAKASGVEFFAKVSGGRAVVGPDAESVVGRAHYRVEEAMKASGLGWIILRPGLYMQNTLAQAALIKSDNKMVLPFPNDVPMAFIDTRDSGSFAAHVVRDPAKHAGKTYEYTGVRSSFSDFAKAFSEVLGRSITYVQASIEQAEQALKARGMPDWLIAHQIAVARIAANGGFSSENTQPIREILGHPPLTIQQFIEDHKTAFS